MHLLATTTASLDDLIEPVDLAQAPAEIVALSFTDSDLAALHAAWKMRSNELPSLRLACLRDLRHPMSVDLWIDKVAAHARVILVRVLGGYEWWRYGCDQLAAIARETGAQLALLPGECRVDDDRLAQLSTVPAMERMALLDYFREGGPQNMRALLRRLARLAGRAVDVEAAQPLVKAGHYTPADGVVPLDAVVATHASAPVVPVIFYRSMLLASDVAPIDALCGALRARGIVAAPIFVQSLHDAAAVRVIEQAVAALQPRMIITTTAFTSGAAPGAPTLFDRLDIPVFQALIATTRREAWANGQRGLAPADLAMHVVLPELDGRIMAGALSFKQTPAVDAAFPAGIQINQPEPDRVAQVAGRAACFLKLQTTSRRERRIAILIPDYPGAPGRTGYAVGLDVPASVLAMLHDLRAEGYRVENIPASPRALLQQLERRPDGLSAAAYCAAFAQLPDQARDAVTRAWGAADTAENSSFRFRAATFGNVTVCIAPDRGRFAERRAEYHDPVLAPSHALIAFGIWLREVLNCHALIHVGAHGTLEWLPGKNVALSNTCFPEIVTGGLPVVYPFIVSNPGEAAQAKRRISAVTIGHLTPPLAGAALGEGERELERLVDEYAQADGLDRRRRDRLAKLILETARRNGLAHDAGVGDTEDADAALLRIDAWLCDLKDFAIKDGLHIFGRVPAADDDPMRSECARCEREALLAALDGRRVAAGPAGAPARGRTDVLPTGRNLFTVDPRTLPTPTAYDLGKRAATEVVHDYLQTHGEWPRALVLDLWGSASLRTGGEEIAQGLALMGCRPQWDAATGRVIGIEVLPPAALDGPRVDVTWRISGLFRDMFPTQIALLDAAVRATAEREETAEENPLAAAARASDAAPLRIFGSAPGTYGSGIEEQLANGGWQTREDLGHAYLAAASHAFGGTEGEGRSIEGAFAARVADADLLLHTSDDAGRDILEGSADVAFIGGFAAAVAALGGKADVVLLDSTDPMRPRARSVRQAITRTVRARAVNPRFIAGQLRHGPRGAAEFAETVDRLVGFAETTEAVPGALIEALYDAYVGDATVRDFLLCENPAAARAIAERLASARRRGLWHPQRNSLDDDLAAFAAEAQRQEMAA